MPDWAYVLTVCINLCIICEYNFANVYLLRLSVKRLLKIHGPASEIPALPSSLDSYM